MAGEQKQPSALRRVATFGAIGVVAVVLAGCNVFGDGTFPVGSLDSQNTAGVVTPGTYESAGGPDCYWQRTDLSGAGSSIIANNFLNGPDVVTILPTDGGFQSQSCGLWTPLPTSGPEATSFSDGGYAIGIAIAPGTYEAPGGPDCHWEQDSNFLDAGTSIISDNFGAGPQTVTLAPNAVRFLVQGCGTWMQDPTAQPGDTCTATMSNSTPGDSGDDTVNVTSTIPDAPVLVTKHYRTTTTTDTGMTDGGGSVSITFDIGNPTINFTVQVDVDINSGAAACSTSFTPQ